MALIQCEECKKEISDLSEKCIHCGYPMKPQRDIQQVEISGFSGKAKLYINVVIISAILLCGTYLLHMKYRQFECERLILESIPMIELASITSAALQEATYSVWRRAIKTSDDFNVELSRFADRQETKNIKDTISKILKDIETVYSKIAKNEKYLSLVYVDFSELYIKTGETANLAIDPEGNLTSYGEAMRKNKKEIDAILQRVKLKVRNAKEQASFWGWLLAS